jgi:MFS transporter, ACS family, glucarate transporter
MFAMNASASSDPTPPTRVRHVVLGLTLSLVALAYLDRVCIATAAPAIRQDLGLDAEQMGFVFSAFTLSYALFEVPSGYFADRFGARMALTRIVVWWSLMTAMTGLASGFLSLLALRFLFGIGEAGAFPSTARVYARWLPENARGWAFGLAIATGAVAGAATMKLVVWLLGLVTWRIAFAMFGVVGFVWAGVWWWFFRDDPGSHPRVNDAELRVIGNPSEEHPSAVPWNLIFRSRSLLTLCFMYLAAIYGWYFYLTWLPTYLKEARGFDLTRAGTLSSLPLLGIAAGVWGGGFASDRLARRYGSRARRLPGVVGFPVAAAATLGAATTPNADSAAWLLTAAAGFGAMGVAPAWAVCLEIGGKHAGVISGAMNMFGNLGGTLSPILVGMCVKRLSSWSLALETVAAFYVAAALLWLLVDPREKIAT